MPNPIAPSEFRNCVPSMSGSACDKFHKAFKTFPELLSEWFTYVYNEDGSFTDEFKADLCAIDCSTVSGGGGSGTGALATPVPSFSQVSNTFIKLTWPSIPSAAFYEVWRNNSPDLTSAEFVGATTDVFYSDTSVTGSTYYYYWVRCRNAVNISSFSPMVLAFTSTSSALVLPGAPTATATDGTIAQYVHVSWTPVQGALDYRVYRHTADTLTGATLLTTTKQLAYADFYGVPGTAYYYIIQAKNNVYTATSTGVIGSR